MAKKAGANKTHAVAEYLKAHPKATSPEIAEALSKQGITIKASHVANIKSMLKRRRRVRKMAKAAVGEAAAATVTADGRPSRPGETITLDQIKKVAQMVNTIGGFDRLHEMLSIIKEVGGLKKFKDLLDAMSATEPGMVPF
jgi:hypothetical protein